MKRNDRPDWAYYAVDLEAQFAAWHYNWDQIDELFAPESGQSDKTFTSKFFQLPAMEV